MAELSHSVVSPTSFRVEYKRNGTGPVMFQRHIKFQVSFVHLEFCFKLLTNDITLCIKGRYKLHLQTS